MILLFIKIRKCSIKQCAYSETRHTLNIHPSAIVENTWKIVRNRSKDSKSMRTTSHARVWNQLLVLCRSLRDPQIEYSVINIYTQKIYLLVALYYLGYRYLFAWRIIWRLNGCSNKTRWLLWQDSAVAQIRLSVKRSR